MAWTRPVAALCLLSCLSVVAVYTWTGHHSEHSQCPESCVQAGVRNSACPTPTMPTPPPSFSQQADSPPADLNKRSFVQLRQLATQTRILLESVNAQLPPDQLAALASSTASKDLPMTPGSPSAMESVLEVMCPRPMCYLVQQSCIERDPKWYTRTRQPSDPSHLGDVHVVSKDGYQAYGRAQLFYDGKMARVAAGAAEQLASKRWPRCAVVANSGLMLAYDDGDEIDGHDAVFRFNVGPTHGYEKHVGVKTTVRFMTTTDLNWALGVSTSSMNETRLNPPQSYLDDTEYVASRALSSDWAKFQRGLDAVLARNLQDKVAYLSLDSLARRPIECVSSFNPEFHGFSPTSGVIGFLFATSVCGHISLYGFQDVQEHTRAYSYYTYYDPAFVNLDWETRHQSSGEDVQGEHDFFKQLALLFPTQLEIKRAGA